MSVEASTNNKKMYSNSITFIDTTDSRTLIVRLTSNHPTVQIYNPNTNAYSPSWASENPLIISPSIYVDSSPVNISDATVVWYRKDLTNSNLVTLSTTMNNGQQVDSGTKALRVSQNVLSASQIVTYVCSVQYDDNLTASAEISFVRSDMGSDGRSLTINGTATSVTPVSGTNYFIVTNINGPILNAQIGDSWLYDGDLYVLASQNASGVVDYFYNAGHIQGPSGASAKHISLNASSQVFNVNKLGVISPSTIKVVGVATNTQIISWQYSTDGGTVFSSTQPNGVNRLGNQLTIIGTSFAGTSLIIRASDGTNSDTLTIYKAFDGADGQKGQAGDPAPTMFLTSNNIIFNADDNNRLYPTSISVNIVSYIGDNKIMPQVGNILGVPGEIDYSVSDTLGGREKVITFNIPFDTFLSGNTGSIVVPVNVYKYVAADTFDENELYYSDSYGTALAEQPDENTFHHGQFYKISSSAYTSVNMKIFWHKIKQMNIISSEPMESIYSIIDEKIIEKLDGIAEELSRI